MTTLTTSLPGNPFDPCHAYTSSDTITEEYEIRWVEDDGQTDATLIALNRKQLTNATMALAYEQHTANLIALLPQLPQVEVWNELVTEITDRLSLNDGSPE